MSLYKDASLVMIPSAVKDGKLYSIRPTDGDGDFTFSRGSNLAATRVDVNGLIEKGRENLALQGSDISTQSGSWVVNQGGVTTQNATTSPIGTNTASQITANGSNTYSGVSQTGIVMGALRYTYSVYLKAQSGTPDIRLTSYDGVTFHQQDFSITTEWERYSITFTPTAGTHSIYITSQQGVSWYAWGAQFELGLVATDYIETGASTAQAGILEDLPRLDYSGGASCPSLKLEPQRSNLVPFSEYFGDSSWNNSNAVTRSISTNSSPEGKLNAYDIIPTTANSNHTLRAPNLSGFTSGAVVNVSFFAKQNGYKFISVVGGFGSSSTPAVVFNLDNGSIVSGTGTIEDYGNGWYRCVSPITLNATALYCVSTILNDSQSGSFAGDGTSAISVYGFQIEAGSYPTSYIPTYGSAVTRTNEYFDTNVDLQTEGILGSTWTFLYDNTFIDIPRDDTAALFLIQDVSGNSARVSLNSDGSFRLQISRVGSIANVSANKIVGRYDGSSVEFFADGVSVGSASALPNEFANLNDYAPSTRTAKTIRLNKILIFPTALTDSECIALTTL